MKYEMLFFGMHIYSNRTQMTSWC